MPALRHTKHAQQSDTAVGHGPDVEEDFPHMWEKIPDNILESMNKRFDLLKLKTLINA